MQRIILLLVNEIMYLKNKTVILIYYLKEYKGNFKINLKDF